MMKVNEFIEKLKKAVNSPTVYVMGGFGAPLDYGRNATRFTSNYSYNVNHKLIILKDKHRFAFDCVCLGKGILWGWNADFGRIYGGADYGSNGVPDFGTESIPKMCSTYSTNFSNIEPGEWLYMPGHAGYYIGDGKVIECTPAWSGNVQITECWNVKKTSSKGRKWVGHGKLKFIDYTKEIPAPAPEPAPAPAPEPAPAPAPAPVTSDKIKKGDLVQIIGTKYYGNKTVIPAWVRNQKWYVYEVNKDRIVINENQSHTNRIMSPVNVNDLRKV